MNFGSDNALVNVPVVLVVIEKKVIFKINWGRNEQFLNRIRMDN